MKEEPLTIKELECIIGCDSFNQFLSLPIALQKKQHILDYIDTIPLTNVGHKVSNAIVESFTEGANTPVYVLGLIVSTLAFSFSPLIYITLGAVLFNFLSLSYHILANYAAIRMEADKNTRDTQFIQFQQTCIEYLIHRCKHFLSYNKNKFEIRRPNPDLACTKAETLEAPTKWEKYAWLLKAKKVLNTTLVLGIIITESFHVTALLVAPTLLASTASLLIGPVGLGVLFSLTAAFCIFMAYKQYRFDQDKEKCEHQRETMSDELWKQVWRYEHLKNVQAEVKHQQKRKFFIHKHPLHRTRHKHDEHHGNLFTCTGNSSFFKRARRNRPHFPSKQAVTAKAQVSSHMIKTYTKRRP